MIKYIDCDCGFIYIYLFSSSYITKEIIIIYLNNYFEIIRWFIILSKKKKNK